MAEPIARDPRLILPKTADPITPAPDMRARAVEGEGVSATITPEAAKAAEKVAAAAEQERRPAALEIEPKTQLVIRYDKNVDRFVYEGIDKETGEVVAQYPSERTIRTIAAFRELTGLTVDEEA
jgi:uncharacterized FlaG/YvyC family protein